MASAKEHLILETLYESMLSGTHVAVKAHQTYKRVAVPPANPSHPMIGGI